MIRLILVIIVCVLDGTSFGRLSERWVDEAREEGWRIDTTDELVFERTMQDFGRYLETSVGERKLGRIARKVETPYDLSRALDKVTGKRFGEHYPSFYAWSESESFILDTTWLSRKSEHFLFLYHPGSKAAQDISLIEMAAEQAFNQISAILGADSQEYSRLERIVMTGDTTPYYTAGRIPVRLHHDRRSIGGFEESSGGQTGFRPVWFGDTVGYALWINLGYPGPAGLFGISHETAHALALLYLSDESKLSEILSSDPYVNSNKLRSAVLPDDLLRLEGWAYMVQNNYSAYVRLALWRSSREAVASAIPQFGFPDCFNLLNGEVSKTALERTLSVLGMEKSVNYAERMRYFFSAADMIRFLYERYGGEKLARFLSDQREPMEALYAVYGLTPYALEEAWRKDVVSE